MAEQKVIANNRKARHDYFIEEVYEAGIVLTGTEIKSLRQGKASLNESFAKIDKGEIYVYGLNISPYDFGNIFNVDPVRPRKILLHRREINKISGYIKLQGLTLIPLKLYIDQRGRAKLELAVAKGKKLYDKRHDLADKDADRRIQRNKGKTR